MTAINRMHDTASYGYRSPFAQLSQEDSDQVDNNRRLTALGDRFQAETAAYLTPGDYHHE